MRAFGFAFLACICAGLSSVAAAQVYKWVDERGVTHYGQRPPGQQPARQMSGAPPPATAAAPAATPVPPVAASAGGRRSNAATFAECRSRSCQSVRRVDADCRTSLCTEALALPDDCSTIACQGRRAELDKRVAQQQQNARSRADRDPSPRDPVGDARAKAQAQGTANAIARCKQSRGINCDDPKVAAQWARQDRPITDQERMQAINARRQREACRGVRGALGC